MNGRIKRGRMRMLATRRSAHMLISTPASVWRAACAYVAGASQPRSVWGVLRLAWRSAVAAWRCARAQAGSP